MSRLSWFCGQLALLLTRPSDTFTEAEVDVFAERAQLYSGASCSIGRIFTIIDHTWAFYFDGSWPCAVDGDVDLFAEEM